VKLTHFACTVHFFSIDVDVAELSHFYH